MGVGGGFGPFPGTPSLRSAFLSHHDAALASQTPIAQRWRVVLSQ
jgi:hypothetical protein